MKVEVKEPETSKVILNKWCCGITDSSVFFVSGTNSKGAYGVLIVKETGCMETYDGIPIENLTPLPAGTEIKMTVNTH